MIRSRAERFGTSPRDSLALEHASLGSVGEHELEKGETMNDKFDQLAKGVASSVTRRQAFKRFAFGLAAMLAAFALPTRADKTCTPSGEFCGNGVPGDNCGKCCSKSFFCIHSEDVAKTCFCN